MPGTEASLIKNPDTNPEELPSKLNGKRFNAGESVKIMVPSSGGYGDPLERSAKQVYEDVLDEIVSVETALHDYGVVIEAGELNMELTEKSRANMRRRRGQLPLFTS